MTTVVLVCVAAVSGTFLARRMRELAPDVTFEVSTLDALPDHLAGATGVLVAPQLGAELDRVREIAGGRPVAVLDGSSYAPGHATEAVERMRMMLAEPDSRREHA